MADTSPNIAFTRIQEGQDAAEVNVNDNFNLLDAILKAGVEDRDLSAAPAGVNGNVYIVAGTPAGGDPWEGKSKNIAAYYDGWIFVAPLEGMRTWVKDEDLEVFYDGSDWSAVAQRGSHKDAITANAGGGQGSATQLLHEINRVTVVATAGDSVKLPTAAPGMVITVINDDASESMDVFPATGDQIDSNGTNNADAVAAGKVITYFCAKLLLWRSQLGA